MGRARTNRVVSIVSSSVLLLLAACGDDSEDAFCEETTQLQEAMGGGDGLQDREAAGAAADQAATLRTMEPPDEVAGDWELAIPPLADFLEASSAAAPYLEGVEGLNTELGPEGLGEVDGLDATDADAVAAVTDLVQAVAALEDERVVDAGERVGEYVAASCGDDD